MTRRPCLWCWEKVGGKNQLFCTKCKKNKKLKKHIPELERHLKWLAGIKKVG